MSDLGLIAIVIIILFISFCGEPYFSSRISCDTECTENKETGNE